METKEKINDDDISLQNSELVFDPYNPNNKEVPIQFVCDILKKYGADILRIWVASSNYAEDLRIDYSILDQHAEAYRKIRNTFRFLLGNIRDKYENYEFDKIDTNNLPELEQLMLHKLSEINEKFHSSLLDYVNSYKP